MIVESKSRKYELKRYGDLCPNTYYFVTLLPKLLLKSSDWVVVNPIANIFYPILTKDDFLIGKPFSMTDHCLVMGRSLSSQEVKDLQKCIFKRRKRMIFNCVTIIFLFLVFCFCVGLIGSVTKDPTSTPILFLSIIFITETAFLSLTFIK